MNVWFNFASMSSFMDTFVIRSSGLSNVPSSVGIFGLLGFSFCLVSVLHTGVVPFVLRVKQLVPCVTRCCSVLTNMYGVSQKTDSRYIFK